MGKPKSLNSKKEVFQGSLFNSMEGIEKKQSFWFFMAVLQHIE
jgi:hypothetical protein